MRQPDNLPAFCRVHRNGRPLIGRRACSRGSTARKARFGQYSALRGATVTRSFTASARVMTGCGLAVEDLIEVQVPPGAVNNDFPEFPDEWVRRWPVEEVWSARRRPT